MSLAAVACDSGLGHARRVVAISDVLLQRCPALRLRLFAPSAMPQRFAGWQRWERLRVSPSFSFIPFETHVGPRVLRKQVDALDWVQRLPRLTETVVWSDNLPDVLSVRPNAILSGSFLWHEVFSTSERPWQRRHFELLKEHRPRMLANAFFATPAVRDLTDMVPLNMLAYEPEPSTSGQHDAILIGIGDGHDAQYDFAALAERIPVACGTTAVFLEPALVGDSLPDTVHRFDYSPEAFARIGAACVRPGFGKLMDCLQVGVRVFALHESDNFEMEHNIQTLENLGVGEGHSSWESSISAAARFLADDAQRRNHKGAVATLKWNGLEQAADFLQATL